MGDTAIATSGAFTPTSVGTWCFAAVYTPATESNYTGSGDNISGAPSSAECFTVTAATNNLTTTILPPADTTVANNWGDSATVAGNSVGGPPTGTVSWTLCQETAPSTPCTGGPSVGSTSSSSAVGDDSIFTLPDRQTPAAVGTYCFNAAYGATPGGNYSSVPQQSGTECFGVTPATSSSTTTASPTAVVIGPSGTVTDSVKVTGNSTGGAPTGTVAFTACGPFPGPALCPSGTVLPPTSVTLTPGTADTSTATSGKFTPTSVGTWCFAAVYAPASGSNYTGSSDNIAGTPSSAECFSVTAATPGFTTKIVPPSATTVGNTWGDTATVAGNSAGGAPTGTVSWTLCQESAPSTPCTGGPIIGSDNLPSTTGNDSTFTLDTPQTPAATGTYCFNASYAATPGGNYSDVGQQNGGAECFTVTAATSSSATTASPTSVVIGPSGTATDSVTVTGNPTGGAPTGSVAFTVCGPFPGPALCPSGRPVATSEPLTPGTGITSTATSGNFTPSSVGTWCFAAVYTPATGSSYSGSSDNVAGLPSSAECFSVTAATPGFTTTIVPPADSAVGNPWGDTATVAGNSVGGPPAGTVSWTLCQETVARTSCTGGTPIGSDDSPSAVGDDSTFTLPNAQTPTVGTWCFNASYAPNTGNNYQPVAQQSGTECFTVAPAPSSSKTTASQTSVVIGPTGSVTDSVTVTGNSTGGAPTGNVTFTVCGPLPGPALCPSGAPVPTSVPLTPGTGITSSATSGDFTPTSVGSWCFAAVYTPASGSNYTGSSDNVSGSPSGAECFSVTAATPGFTTTIVPPTDSAVGNTWGDTATVVGNAVGGAPSGTVNWTLCQETAPSTPCSSGTPIGSDNSPTTTGDESTFTLDTPQTPTAAGTYCFNASYAATPGGNYSDVAQQNGGAECFTVTAATSSSATTASPTSVIIGPSGTATDSVTVTGNPAGGAPTGTVAFTVCGPFTTPALCPSGTSVAPTPVTLIPGTGDTSSATSGAFTPTSVGTWCFAAVYTPAAGSNYTASSDNIAGLPSTAECFSDSAAAPAAFTTTILPPLDRAVGDTWGDTATVAGNSIGGPPSGTVSWNLCQETAPPTPCTGGNPIGSTDTSTTNGFDSIFTLPTPQTPTAAGTYCFNESFAATPGGNYNDVAQQSGTECFTVDPAPSSSSTTASPTLVVIGPTGTATDSVTVTGNPTGGAPTGTVAFSVCGPLPAPALCPSGTAVPPTTVNLTPATEDTSSATSGSFTPTQIGIWCFAAVYTPASGSNYTASSDNIAGTASSAECFTAAENKLTTTILPPIAIAVGNTWGDTATVEGNSTGGPPTGTVSWTLCQESAPSTPCTGGTNIGSTGRSTTNGIDSTFTLPNPQSPKAGTWCFDASYAPTAGTIYQPVTQQDGTECFTVDPASPGFTSAIVPPTNTAVGNTWGDTATVVGNSTGGPPTGTVTWTLCQATPPATSCTGGTNIGSTGRSNPTGNSSTFTLPTPQAPTAAGTYCFNESFAATPGGNYMNVARQTSLECFTVTAATSPPTSPSVPVNTPPTSSPAPAAPPSPAAASIAFTGSYIGGMTLGGLALIGTGAFMLRLSRRRRRARGTS
jgi:hypothetical protein